MDDKKCNYIMLILLGLGVATAYFVFLMYRMSKQQYMQLLSQQPLDYVVNNSNINEEKVIKLLENQQRQLESISNLITASNNRRDRENPVQPISLQQPISLNNPNNPIQKSKQTKKFDIQKFFEPERDANLGKKMFGMI